MLGDGQYVTVEGASASNLPVQDVTAEGWVKLSHSIRWGGIIGYIQDNGYDDCSYIN